MISDFVRTNNWKVTPEAIAHLASERNVVSVGQGIFRMVGFSVEFRDKKSGKKYRVTVFSGGENASHPDSVLVRKGFIFAGWIPMEGLEIRGEEVARIQRIVAEMIAGHDADVARTVC